MDKKFTYGIILLVVALLLSVIFETQVPNSIAQRHNAVIQQRVQKLTNFFDKQLPDRDEWQNIVSTILIEEGTDKSMGWAISDEHFNAHVNKLINAFSDLVRVTQYSLGGDIINVHSRTESIYNHEFAESLWLNFSSKLSGIEAMDSIEEGAIFSFETKLSGPIFPYLPLLSFAFRHPYNESIWLLLSFDMSKAIEHFIDQAASDEYVFLVSQNGNFISHSDASLQASRHSFTPMKFDEVYRVSDAYASSLIQAERKGLVSKESNNAMFLVTNQLNLNNTEVNFSIGLLRATDAFKRELMMYRIGYYSFLTSVLLLITCIGFYLRNAKRSDNKSQYQKELNDALFAASLDGMVTIAEDYSIKAANYSAAHMLELVNFDKQKISLAMLFAQSTQVSFTDLLAQYKEGLLLNVTEILWTRQDQRKLRLLCTIKSVCAEDKAASDYIFVFKDVTQHQETIASLVQTIRDLKAQTPPV